MAGLAIAPSRPHPFRFTRDLVPDPYLLPWNSRSYSVLPRLQPDTSPLMEHFPEAVVTALHAAGVTMTCLPVQIDDADDQTQWEAAFFFVLPESFDDAAIKQYFDASAPFPVIVEGDLLEHENATAVELLLEINIGADVPLAGEVLFLTGHASSHFEVLELLSKQQSVGLFIGDKFCKLVHQQRFVLADEHRAGLTMLLEDATRRDAVIRLTGTYDASVAFDALIERKS